MLHALTLLLACQLAGEVLARLSGLPVPGPVIGFLGLFVGLALTQRLPTWLDTTANTLLKHLPLLFVPAGVGVMLHAGRIGAEWLPIAAALVLSTALSLAVTILVFRLALRLQGTPPTEDEL